MFQSLPNVVGDDDIPIVESASDEKAPWNAALHNGVTDGKIANLSLRPLWECTPAVHISCCKGKECLIYKAYFWLRLSETLKMHNLLWILPMQKHAWPQTLKVRAPADW